MRLSIRRPLVRLLPPRPIGIAIGLSALGLAAAPASAKPKEIIIETSPSPSPSKSAIQLTDLERRALDNALVAGSVDYDPPIRITKGARRVAQEISVRGGRCYDVSVAWKGSYRTTITYLMQRSGDGRPLNDFSSSESGQSYPGEGIVHFCVDRSGQVKLEIMADETSGSAEATREYAIIAAYRPETSAQAEARRRRTAAAQKQAAEAAHQATPAEAPDKE